MTKLQSDSPQQYQLGGIKLVVDVFEGPRAKASKIVAADIASIQSLAVYDFLELNINPQVTEVKVELEVMQD
jgi:hypothetical protein